MTHYKIQIEQRRVARARPWRATTEDDGPWHDRRRDSLEFLRSSAHFRSFDRGGSVRNFNLCTRLRRRLRDSPYLAFAPAPDLEPITAESRLLAGRAGSR